MTIQEARTFYQSKHALYSSKLEETRKKIRLTSVFRISIFIITVVAIYVASAFQWMVMGVAGLTGISLFIYMVIRHERLFRKKQWFERLTDINQTELEVLAGNISSKYDGAKWNQPGHPYISDLDIFGKKSLFQLIDRSATHEGRELVARQLLDTELSADLLKQRQEAIAELAGKPDFRQFFEATGNPGITDESSLPDLLAWISHQQYSFNTLFNRLMLVVNPLLGFGVVILIIFNVISINAFLLFLIVPFGVMMPKVSRINKEHVLLSKKSELFKKYGGLLKLVEQEEFESGLLNQIKEALVGGRRSASFAIEKLSKILNAFDYRLNLLVGFLLNIFLLWDIRQAIRLERWKQEHKDHIGMWFEQLAQVDALCSFAGFAFSHPGAVMPEFSSSSFLIDAKDVKHPLIQDKVSVGNDVSFTGWKQFHIITGANMAGKSTYLRTVGVNLVLAMTGAPVLAERFVFTPVNLFTGIKTSDSLQEGESYFFAELKRLENMIRQLEQGKPLFVILDEILRGTNSADKQKGSKALISQLIKLGASGMIATHDLTLADLAAEFPGHVTTLRFEVEIKNDELVFDYKLKDGVSQNLNASFLMKKMGIILE